MKFAKQLQFIILIYVCGEEHKLVPLKFPQISPSASNFAENSTAGERLREEVGRNHNMLIINFLPHPLFSTHVELGQKLVHNPYIYAFVKRSLLIVDSFIMGRQTTWVINRESFSYYWQLKTVPFKTTPQNSFHQHICNQSEIYLQTLTIV